MRVWVLAAASAAMIVVAAAVTTIAGREQAAVDSRAAEHPVTVPQTARTVAVSPTMPMPSVHERRLSAMLEEGQMPDQPTMGDVLTDSDCAPDAKMISRCRNVVKLVDGRQIVLRHPHDMSRIPCLAPGERVRLIPSGL